MYKAVLVVNLEAGPVVTVETVVVVVDRSDNGDDGLNAPTVAAARRLLLHNRIAQRATIVFVCVV